MTTLLLCWAAAIAWIDLRQHRIPNILTLSACVVAMAVLVLRQSSCVNAPWLSAVQAAGFALLVTLPGYLTRRLGAGDVKYLVAIGLLTSLHTTVLTFAVAALSGGTLALLWLKLPALMPCLPRAMQQPGSTLVGWLHTPFRQRRMAFGPLLSAGLLVSLVVPLPT